METPENYMLLILDVAICPYRLAYRDADQVSYSMQSTFMICHPIYKEIQFGIDIRNLME